MHELLTPRLVLRQWRPADRPSFAELNADETVMRHFTNTLTVTESDALVDRLSGDIEINGWGFWAIERRTTGAFVGFTGLQAQPDRFTFSPCVEIGWRLAQRHWGQGFATEAAIAAVEFGFTQLEVQKIASFTTLKNTASQNVMRRIGMVNTQRNFLHPSLPATHPLAEHVLFEITEQQWRA